MSSSLSSSTPGVGINYIGTDHPLKGCINDVKNMHKFICDRFGYANENIIVLTDDADSPAFFPTKANIVKYMRWLVEDAGYDDALYFHYSGHGVQVRDRALDESDHADEAICPFDFEAAGMLRDDSAITDAYLVHELLVKPLPAGARLTAIFDSCHSGSIMDIPYVYNPEEPPKEPIVSPEGDKSWLSQGIKHNRKLIQQIAEQLAAALKPVPPGPTGPALLRAADIPVDAEHDWNKMLPKHRLILVEALEEHALASLEALQAGVDASGQAPGVADDTSRSALSQFIKHNPKIVQAVRAAATQAALQYLGFRGIEGVDDEEDIAEKDTGDTDKKLNWRRFRPPPISKPAVIFGETVAQSFGVPHGAVTAGAAIINAIRGIDGDSANRAPQIPQGSASEGVDSDRSWLSQAVRHNRKTINRIGQVIADAIVDSIAGSIAKERSIELMAATGSSPADVICWSGCLDNQKATDTFLDGQAVGAMSYAFVTAMNQNPTQSYMELLKAIRAILKDRYKQIVQLSSSHPINTDLQFIA